MELLTKAHYKCLHSGGKRKAAKYYQKNKEMIEKRERKKYKLITVEEKKIR